MASAGILVDFLVADFPVLQPRINELNRLLVVLDGNDDQVLNKSLPLLITLPDLQFSVGRVEQVIDILHVNLHERDTNTPLLLIP